MTPREVAQNYVDAIKGRTTLRVEARRARCPVCHARTCEECPCRITDYEQWLLTHPEGIEKTDAAFARATAYLAGDAAARKAAPIASGVLFYFPNALAAVANLSKVGNEQHNPGQPMHWAFDKSTDEADCITRHLAQSGTVDTDGIRHSVKVAWRALALLERELLAAHPELEPGKNVRGARPAVKP